MFRQFPERRCPSAPVNGCIEIQTGIPDVVCGMLQEQDSQIVFDRMTDQYFILQQVANLNRVRDMLVQVILQRMLASINNKYVTQSIVPLSCGVNHGK